MSVPYERRARLAHLSLVHCVIEPTEQRVAALAEAAGRLADTFPPLTSEQRASLAVLLRPVRHWEGAA